MGINSQTHYHFVTENRAPTDKSVELLNEFQEKAKQNLLNAISIQDNILNGAMLFFSDDVMVNEVRCIGKFKINHRTIKINFKVDRTTYASYYENIQIDVHGRAVLVPNVLEQLSKHIAEQILIHYAHTNNK